VSEPGRIELRLYVAGDSPRSRIALAGVRRLDEMLRGGCRLEVIDITEQPGRAEQDRILATPTLVRLSPAPSRRIVGDLASVPHLLTALGILLDEKAEIPLEDSGR
jgi:circadian clock protein KaiB